MFDIKFDNTEKRNLITKGLATYLHNLTILFSSHHVNGDRLDLIPRMISLHQRALCSFSK